MAKSEHTRTRGNGAGSLVQSKSGRWIAWYFDSFGRRVKRSTRTTNRRDAERMLGEWTRETELVRAGVLDGDQLRHRDELTRPLADHVRDYFESFKTKPRTKASLIVKTCVLRRLLLLTRTLLGREPMLRDFTPDILRRAMKARIDEGRSARTANLLRQDAVALASWLTAEGRANLSDFSKRAQRFNESLDRRKVRRALTPDELARLLAVAHSHGRRLWYSLAYFVGLRLGELTRMTWSDVDFENGTLKIRNVKAGRLDELPLRPELLDELRATRPLLAPSAANTSRVFPICVHARTRRLDFKCAGILAIDADGRVADLHALRTTLCTNLARLGVPIQLTQRAMRHSDPRTTQRHYTMLGLADVSIAFNALAAIELPTMISATGTTDSSVASLEKSGSSSGSSRRTKRHEMASLGENPSTKTPEIETTQPVTPREDTRRFDTRREVLLQFPIQRTISDVD